MVIPSLRALPQGPFAPSRNRVYPLRCSAFFTLLALAIVPFASRADTLLNDDFSEQNPVNATDYSLVSAGVHTNPLEYRVVDNPSTSFTNGYASFFDHTTGTASGEMLFFDGAPSANTRVFYRSENLIAGAQYTFTYWAAFAGGSSAPPAVQAQVDSTPLDTAQTTTVATWQQFSYVYTPLTGGAHVFSIVDTNTVGSGNDGALDDISLTGPVPEPASVCLILVSSVGTLRRHRR